MISFLQKIYGYANKCDKGMESAMQVLFEPAPEIPLVEFKQENISL